MTTSQKPIPYVTPTIPYYFCPEALEVSDIYAVSAESRMVTLFFFSKIMHTLVETPHLPETRTTAHNWKN